VCQFSAQKVKGRVDGRTLCRHWANIFLVIIIIIIIINNNIINY